MTSRPKKRGFTLIELLVVISIISLLVALLLPVLSKAREAATTIRCLSDQRQVGVAVNIYGNDFDGQILTMYYNPAHPNGFWNHASYAKILTRQGGYLPLPGDRPAAAWPSSASPSRPTCATPSPAR